MVTDTVMENTDIMEDTDVTEVIHGTARSLKIQERLRMNRAVS